jgi:hypothetical protein
MNGMPMMTGTLEHLRRPLVPNVRPGMKVLVVTDTAHDPRVWQAVMGILTELGAEATLAMFDPRPADYYDPPRQVCEAMLKSDINVLLASTGMLHSPANGAAMKAGVPVICMDGGMTLEMFQSGAVTEDQKAMAIRHYYVGTNIFGLDAKQCRVTSKYGCDFTYSVEGRIYKPKFPGDDFQSLIIQDVAKVQNRKSSLLRLLYPNGEYNVAPVEYSGSGKLVIDLCAHQIGLLKDPIELTVVDGMITSIDGGKDAYFLRNYLEQYGDANAYICPSEASVGINSKALVRGVQREDKNILGSMHFGLGTNSDVGGTIHSNIHIDGVILEPTLYVDGDMRIERGKFLRPLDRPYEG